MSWAIQSSGKGAITLDLKRIISDVVVAKLEPSLLTLKSEYRGTEISDIPQVAINRKMRVLAKGREAEALKSQRLDQEVVVINPFSHLRVIVSDQKIAALVLREFIYALYGRRHFLPRITMLLHPHKAWRGDMADIESDALFKACIEAGIRVPWIVMDSEAEFTAKSFEEGEKQMMRLPLLEMYFRNKSNQ